MTNVELENKIKDLIAINNYFDMVIAVKDFEKEYKESDFYKATKQPLFDVIKNAKMHYALQSDYIITKIQKMINDLDYSKINTILDQFADVFEKENIEVQGILDLIKA